jgi:Ca2+-binding RTX toxin-like protein
MRATARLIQICTLATVMVAATVLPGGAAGAEPPQLNPNARASVVDQDTVKFTAAVGKSDHLVITSDSSMVMFDGGYPITPGAGCVNPAGDATVAICHPADVAAVLVYVADGNDTVVIHTDIHVTAVEVHGGSGNDLLYNDPYKSYLTVRLFGEAGDDNLVDNWWGEHHAQLYGGDGNDHLSCSQTANNWGSELYGGSGADIFAGKCMIDYSDRTTHVNVSIDGIANDGAPGEGDNVQTSVLGLFGGSGNDVFSSTVKTLLIGNDGADWLFGSDFNDTLWADDGAGVDIVFGGYGHDVCSVDAGDSVSFCE